MMSSSAAPAKSTGPYVNQHIPIAESVLRDYGSVTVTIDDEVIPTLTATPASSTAPESTTYRGHAYRGGAATNDPDGFDDDDDVSPSPPPLVAETVALIETKDTVEADAPVWRDMSFAILFYVHLAVVLYLGVYVAPDGYDRMTLNFTFVTDDGTLVDVNGLDNISFNFTGSHNVKDGAVSEENIAQVEAFFAEAVEYLKVRTLSWENRPGRHSRDQMMCLCRGALHCVAPLPQSLTHAHVAIRS
jgi:hypothetical protein